jgi:hypothetical protein
MQALGNIRIHGMNEKFDHGTGFTKSQVSHRYEGDIEAEARFECITYAPGATLAKFVGLEYLSGRIGDRTGGFILQHVGSIDSGRSESVLNVLSGSGTGGLTGIKGHGRSTSSGGNGQTAHMLLEYSFDDMPAGQEAMNTAL